MGKEDRAIAGQRNSDQRRLGWGEGKSRDRAALRSTTGLATGCWDPACVDIRFPSESNSKGEQGRAYRPMFARL